MSAFRQTYTVLIALLALGLAGMSGSANAGPGHHGPGWGPRPPMHRPLPPPPPMHPRIHHSGWHSGWYWGPLAAGATLWGLGELIDSQRSRNDTPTQVVVPVQPQVQQPTTVYWCESEKGFFPQVRSCPTGWTTLPATATPPN